jgi:hypothetical protein
MGGGSVERTLGRPKVKPEAKKVRVSISVSPEIRAAAEATGNASKFFEEAAVHELARRSKEQLSAAEGGRP